jgi:hypothetical protein
MSVAVIDTLNKLDPVAGAMLMSMRSPGRTVKSEIGDSDAGSMDQEFAEKMWLCSRAGRTLEGARFSAPRRR